MHRSHTLFAVLIAPVWCAAQATLWGMTPIGGAFNKGTLFHVDADGTDFQKVLDFTDSTGWGPEGGMCLSANGKLYGTTFMGGSGSPVAGTLFSFDPAGAGFHKIHDFTITDGGGNWGSLVQGTDDGMLFAGQYMGGAGGGSIYRVDPSSDAYTIVHGLNTTTDGSGITDKLLSGSDGWLYGTAHFGGTFNVGTIFRFDPIGNTFETLHHFTGGEGGDTPYGGLCEAANGWFYGTTYTGGLGNKGILYKYDPVGDQFVTLVSLDTVPGNNCWSSMVNAGPDLLVGTVASGGLNGSGFLFGITPSTDAFEELFSFGATTGGAVVGNPIVGSDGRIYGMCGGGGTLGLGTVYAYDPVSDVHTILHSFDLTTDGGGPRGDLVEAGPGTGLNEAHAGTRVHVAPNPATEAITVSLAGSHATAHYTLHDAVGRTVQQGTLVFPIACVELACAPGRYTLQVRTGQGAWAVPVVKR